MRVHHVRVDQKLDKDAAKALAEIIICVYSIEPPVTIKMTTPSKEHTIPFD